MVFNHVGISTGGFIFAIISDVGITGFGRANGFVVGFRESITTSGAFGRRSLGGFLLILVVILGMLVSGAFIEGEMLLCFAFLL